MESNPPIQSAPVNQADTARFTDMSPKPKTNYMVYVAAIFVVVVIVLIAVALLVLNNNAATPASTSNNNSANSNTNTNTNSNNQVVSQPVTNQNTTGQKIESQEVSYVSAPITINNVDYSSFNYTDTTKSVSYHYLLSTADSANFPILESAVDSQPFLISGTLSPSPAGNAAGNQYFVLSSNVIIEVAAKYVDKEVDPDDATLMDYVFSSCANPAPPCNKYFVKPSLTTSIPFVANLAADDKVAFSGELSDKGGAAGTHYWKMTTITIEKL